MKGERGDDEAKPRRSLFADSRGLPTLFEVAVPGERLQESEYRMQPSQIGDAQETTTEDTEAALSKTLSKAIESAMTDALKGAASDLPRMLKDADRQRDD